MPRTNLMSAFRKEDEDILWLNEALHTVDIHSFSSLSYDRSKASSSCLSQSCPSQHLLHWDKFLTMTYHSSIFSTAPGRGRENYANQETVCVMFYLGI